MPKYDPPWPTKKESPFPQNHHLIPQSRGGKHLTKNLLEGIPSDLHFCWHRLFGNLTPMEILTVLVRHLLKPGEYERYQNLYTGEKDPKPPEAKPDEIILKLARSVFPPDWVPSDRLIDELMARRRGRKR
ncbi:hypothetical protein A2V54_02135 [candidate division WWE3 bacterium RBG_19FT_COMBO_53_11]|uniref:Uncharacterized protein n=1 Tax=candidate division WWE3 bacterium RBG_19FT_COMBO_53_11 TaxID=1802613 RepID=A0A1F4UJ34_UNCKA|nr:MAG: hypothetical protein A2155_00565 [candidate division WWE3 bacterium RBG_16_52_45]OGC44937.1 MAG: hypothetical protein A2V54_02135 [candidate division WWE3 bacterium RBG_19FT_COMBO_53_11]